MTMAPNSPQEPASRADRRNHESQGPRPRRLAAQRPQTLGVHDLQGCWGLWTARLAARIRAVTNSKIDVKDLSAEERLNLIEQIWDSLQAEDVPVTEKQKAELDRRIEEMDRDGKRGIPWEEVMDRIRGRSK